MPESSEVLPVTAPRAARGRTNAGEAVVCIHYSPRSKRSCSELACISRRSRRRKVAGCTLDAQKKQFPPCPPLPDPTTKCRRDCIANVVNIPISAVRWQDAAQETLSIYKLAPPPVFVCAPMKSASILHIFSRAFGAGCPPRPRMFQQQPLIHVRAIKPVPT